jgi:molybdopterin-guanine dinucleotide biosynthesis protein A
MTVSTGYVLAGGESRRMGRDKALLPWGGTTLLGHALDRLRQVCGEVAILAGAEPRYADQGARVVMDTVRDAGPLAGLLAALDDAHTEVVLMLAVDLPSVPPALLAFLLELAGRAEVDVVAPVVGLRPQPLCAAYRRSCTPAVRHHLAEGHLKMTRFWEDVRVRAVPEEELAPFGQPEALLRNLNSAQDYAAARVSVP